MEFKYYMPTRIFFEENCIEKNKEALAKLGSKALIVTGKKSAKMNGSYDDMVKVLDELHISHILFDEVEENPSIETVARGAEIGKENKVDFVIGIGGGSPMDAAKGIAVLIKHPEINQETIFTSKGLDYIPIVAVPTTAGTGSEVTHFSVVSVKKEQIKKNLGQIIFPEVALLDAKYTENLPYHITVNTAIDALSHLVEGYTNATINPMTDLYAEKGFAIFKEAFHNLLNNEMTKEFRENMLLASMLGGLQIAQTSSSLPHGMGHILTFFKKVPHGLANGILMVEYLKSFKNTQRVDRMLHIMGLNSIDDLGAILNQLIELKVDITEEEIAEYAAVFVSDKNRLKNHPEEIGIEEIIDIYKKSLLK